MAALDLIPDQRAALGECPVCHATVPGLLSGCCGDPRCLKLTNDADAVQDFRSEACDE